MSRSFQLTVAQLCCAGLMSGAAHAQGWRAAWSDLWHTPDQQGEAMLAAGEPAQAAARFHDPRRRAYAELEAGRYPQAAKLLAPFGDAESEYNRGNALAHSGQLEAALAAYDAALLLVPADRDTRHNRDLIEQALRQRQAAQPNGSGAPQSGARRPQSNGGAHMTANGSRPGTGRSGGASQQPNSPQATNGSRAGGARDAPAQARSDAAFAASVARQQQHVGARNPEKTRAGTQAPGQGPDSGAAVAGGVQTPRQQPESERQLKLDQWLRQIPDSPAGLLQRQFLIEHMMREQDGGGSPWSGQ